MFSCFQTPSLLSLTLPGLGSRAELLLLGGSHGGSQPGSHFHPSQVLWHCQVQTPGTQGELRGQPCSQSLQISPFFQGWKIRHSFSTMDARKTHFQVPQNSTLGQELQDFSDPAGEGVQRTFTAPGAGISSLLTYLVR